MKKFFIALSVFMSVNSIMQTMYADTPITLDDKSRETSHGPRRAPKKNKASLELYLDEASNTLRFSASSEEHIVVVIFNAKGMHEQDDVLDICPDTDGIISLKSLERGEYVICVYNKGVESKGTFTLQ